MKDMFEVNLGYVRSPLKDKKSAKLQSEKLSQCLNIDWTPKRVHSFCSLSWSEGQRNLCTKCQIGSGHLGGESA